MSAALDAGLTLRREKGIMSSNQDGGELSPGGYKVVVIFYLLAALCFAYLALREPAGGGLTRYITPLLCCYVAAYQCVQLARLRSGLSLRKPPMMVFRYVGLAFCVATTYSLLSTIVDRGFIHVLLCVGLVAFWGVVFLSWRALRSQDRAWDAEK